MPVNVSDFRANPNENIRHAAQAIGRSKDRRAVFEAIYHGKKKVKTVPELMAKTGLSHKRVLTEGRKLVASQLVEQDKIDKRVAYKKDETIGHYKKKILDLLDHPEKKNRYPTKQEPRVSGQVVTHRIAIPRSYPQPQAITVDDIDSFAAVRRVAPGTVDLTKVLESHVKEFLKRVIGETNEYTDWGGEKNDLYTNRLRLRGARRTAAFAIKGRATRGKLTPKKMGTNGDQVTRLLDSEAMAFFVVYHSQVDQSIHEQLHAHALVRAVGGNRAYYGVIDGVDLGRLVASYPEEFEAAGSA